MEPSRSTHLAPIIALVLALAPLPSLAQQARRATATEIRDAIAKLQSQNMDEVRDAIQFLGVSEAPTAVDPLVTLLRTGPPDIYTEAIVEALGSLARPQALPVLLDYLRHRRVNVRTKVVDAIAAIRDPRVRPALEQGLRDSDPRVRGAAALALGRTAATASLPVLFRAFDRGVPEAAVAIGQLGNAASSEQLLGFLGQRPLPLLLPGFKEFMARRDFPEPAKLHVVEKLLELSGPQVKRFLISFVGTLPENDRSRVRQAAEEAIRRIPDEAVTPRAARPAPAPAPASPEAPPPPAAPAPAAPGGR
jgi:HEAT repeat protein